MRFMLQCTCINEVKKREKNIHKKRKNNANIYSGFNWTIYTKGNNC